MIRAKILGVLLFVAASLNAQNLEWVRSFGGPNGEGVGLSLIVDALGNVYTTGEFEGTVDFDPGTGTSYLTSNGNGDVFVQKMNANGNFLWARSFGGIYDDESHSIALDASGNVYITGWFGGNVDFDPGTGTSYLTSNGDNDVFVQKMNANGNFLWARSFGGVDDDLGYTIVVDASGNVYTTGQYRGTADFDPGTGTINYTSAGERDNFVQKMDANGNFLWARSFGGSDEDYGYSIVDASGNVYTTGYFEGTVDFDPGAGTSYLTSVGAIAAFVQKMDAEGNFLWAKSFGGTSPTTDGAGSGSITVDPAGNVYTTGYFYGTVDFDQGAGTSNLTAVGNPDIFVHKMGQTPSGLIDLGSGIQFAAYPNPTTGKVCLTFAQTVNQVKVILTDMQGKVITEQTLDATPTTGFEMPGPAGAYYLIVKTSQGQSVVKLVKE